MKRRILVLCHFLLLVSGIQYHSFAQVDNSNDSISRLFSMAGFENVKSAIDESKLIVAFENRRYRSQARGLAEVLKIISNSASVPLNTEIFLILLHQEVPMVMVNLVLQDYEDFVNNENGTSLFADSVKITLEFESVWEQIKSKERLNSSNFKSDIVVIPQFRAQFGKFTHPVESSINVIPEYNLLLNKGLSFKAQLIIPVYNDLDEEGDLVRPGIIALNQFVRLKDDVFFDVTVGCFDKNRAGGNFELKKYFSNGRLSLGANVGYTTDYSYTGIKTDYLVDENFLTALLSADYRYEPYDLTGRIQAGNFLYNELGVRCDLLRQFREVTIGFFVLATESELNGGFNFSIPIPPRKYSKPKYFRVSPTEKFSFEYRAKGYPTSGTMYNTENELFRSMLEFNPDYLKKIFLLEIKKYY